MPQWAINKGRGRGYAFLQSLLGHTGDECVVWPMNRQPTGYGALGYNGKTYYAHRLMCEMVNGLPPSPTHEAAHSCGNGKGGCVNPKHLSWKTISENNLDCRKHGTHRRNVWGQRGKLTIEKAREIRRLAATKTQAELSEMFGVAGSTIRGIITGKQWWEDIYRPRRLTREDIAKIRALKGRNFIKAAAERFGVTPHIITNIRGGRYKETG